MQKALDTESDGIIRSSSQVFSERFHDRKRAERYRDRFAQGRHARVDKLERAALRELISDLEHVPAMMDIPCGAGRLSSLFLGVAGRLILADASSTMLDLARDHMGKDDVEYLQARCENITRPNKSIGLVFCHRFLHHLDQPAERLQVLREFARVATHYVILNHYPSGIRTRAKRLLRSLTHGKNGDGRIASTDQLISEAKEAGLQLIRVVSVRRFPVSGSFLLFHPSARNPASSSSTPGTHDLAAAHRDENRP